MTREECWKDIEGYEGFYQVSNFGNIRSKYSGKWKLMKATKTNHSRMIVGLHKNGKVKLFLIHRLVAQSFIPNPNRLPEINHKDENPLNNCVENLEWCTPKYNVNYGTRNKRASENLSRRKVCMFDESGELIEEFRNLVLAARYVNGDHAGIIMSCNGDIFLYKGYLWRYKEEEDTIYDFIQRYKLSKSRCKKVVLSNGKETIHCRSISEASRIVGICNASIRKYSSYGDYSWEIIE